MKLKIERVKLWGAISVLSKVIDTKTTLPILASVRCSVKDSALVMTGSDAEMTYTTTLPLLEQEGEGDFCVNAQNLSNALAVLPEQPVVIVTTEDGRFTLQHQSGETFFPMSGAEEYPLVPEQEFTSKVQLYGTELADAIRRCAWSIPKDDLRPQMNGVCISVEADSVEVVASNGYTLVKTSLIDEGSDPIRVILPRKAAKILTDLLWADNIELKLNETYAQLELGGEDENATKQVLTFRLVEGKYPNYNSVIPTDNDKVGSVVRSWLMNALKQTIPFASSTTSMVQFEFTPGKLYLKGQDLDFSTGSTSNVDMSDYNADNLKIAFDGSRLLTMLQNLKSEFVEFHLKDSDRPAYILPTETEETEEEEKVLMLIMPMQLKD